jgi:hypothetical protein
MPYPSFSSIEAKRRQGPEPGANQHRRHTGQIDHGGRLDAAMTAIENQFELASSRSWISQPSVSGSSSPG